MAKCNIAHKLKVYAISQNSVYDLTYAQSRSKVAVLLNQYVHNIYIFLKKHDLIINALLLLSQRGPFGDY